MPDKLFQGLDVHYILFWPALWSMQDTGDRLETTYMNRYLYFYTTRLTTIWNRYIAFYSISIMMHFKVYIDINGPDYEEVAQKPPLNTLFVLTFTWRCVIVKEQNGVMKWIQESS